MFKFCYFTLMTMKITFSLKRKLLNLHTRLIKMFILEKKFKQHLEESELFIHIYTYIYTHTHTHIYISAVKLLIESNRIQKVFVYNICMYAMYI